MRNATDFAVVPNRVRLNTGEVSFREAGRQWILTHQEFIRAVNILDASPCIVPVQELERGFQQIAVPDVSVRQALIPAP
jgi:hypothetical protein